MDNPDDLVRTLEGQVERLKVIFNEATSALTDDVSEVSQFCVSLECCLRHHQREKLSFWGDRRDYWNYLSEGVARMKTLETIVKRVQTLAQLTTSQGRGRGLIRGSLEQHMLADLVQTALSNSKRTREWYHTTSVLLSPAHSQRLISALYDLSEVDFDLPTEGVDLDETWPSFVMKSFQGSDPRLSLFKGSQKQAIASKKSTAQMLLEQGVEEEASEIYVKQEIPFSIELVSNLLDDIRCNLVGQSETIGGQTHLCPELEVKKLDDITSCLTILRDYITAWSHDITKNSHTLQEEVRQAKVQLADVEMQLQETMRESEGVETSLLNQLQDTRDDLQSCSSQIQELFDDNDSLKKRLSQGRSKILELEALNFSLEEQLMEAQEGEGEGEEVDGLGVEGGRRERSATLIESALQERDDTIEQLSRDLLEREGELQQMKTQLTASQQALHTLSPLPSLLQHQIVEEAEAKAAVYLSRFQLQSEYTDLEHRYQQCVGELEQLKGRGQEVEFHENLERVSEENLQLSREVTDLRTQLAVGMEEVRKGERRKVAELEKEVEKLSSESGVFKDEASALRYQLSSASMELQQMRELQSERERELASLDTKASEQEKLLRESREKQRVTHSEAESFRREVKEVEGLLTSQSAEMNSLSEQLTEKTHSRDKERAELLRAHTSLDSVQAQLETEKQGFAKEVARLTEENTDIRRAFRKLLQQKVTLWQHADKLEQEQQLMGKWINSKRITACMECSIAFSLLVRKHHCRSCGRVCCSKCCDQKAQLPFSKEPVRVCDKCHHKIDQMRTPFVSKFINADPELEDTPPSVRSQSSNSLNIERSVDTTGNSLQAKLMVQNDDSSVSSSYDGRWIGTNGSPLRGAGGSIESLGGSGEILETAPGCSLLPPSTSSKAEGAEGGGSKWSLADEYSVDPESKKKESERSSSRQSSNQGTGRGVEEVVQYHIAAVEGDSLEDSYYLIDSDPQFPVGVDVPGNRFFDVDALASKLASLEVHQHQRVATGEGEGATSSPLHHATGSPGGENSSRGGTGFTEVSLGGGEAHTVTVSVDKKGTTISWEFMSEPKGLAFSLSFEQDAEETKTEQILPLRRCMSHKASLTGEYVAQKTGSYVLRFDNCHSKYSGRRLQYRYWIKPPT